MKKIKELKKKQKKKIESLKKTLDEKESENQQLEQELIKAKKEIGELKEKLLSNTGDQKTIIDLQNKIKKLEEEVED